MGRFLLVAFLDAPLERLSELMAPYNVLNEVEPYLVPCPCLGKKAEREARFIAEQAIEITLDDLRAEWWACPEDDRPPWDVWCRDYTHALQEALDNHPELYRADLDCMECIGTGKRTTTTNPHGHWFRYGVINVIPSEQLVFSFDCWALLTKEGTWYEKGFMSLSGVLGPEVDDETWRQRFLALQDMHRDCHAVLIDCFI